MTKPLTPQEALLYVVFGEEELAREAHDDTARRLRLRVLWLKHAGGRFASRSLEDAAKLLSDEVEKTGGKDPPPRPSDVASLRQFFDSLAGSFDHAPPSDVTFDLDRLISFVEPAGGRVPDLRETNLTELIRRPQVTLDQASRLASSLSGEEGRAVASIVSDHFWAGLDEGMNQFKALTRETRAFGEAAERARRDSRAVLLEALKSAAIMAHTEHGSIPADAWARWEPDWGRSDLGPTVEPSHYGKILLDAVSVRGVATPTKQSDLSIFRTGEPGRPSGMYLVVEEFRGRIEAHKVSGTLKEEAEALAAWYSDTHGKSAPRLMAGTIANVIRKQYRACKPTKI